MSQPNAWIASWRPAQQLCEEGNLPPPPGLASRFLKQSLRTSLGGSAFALRFSNLFGDSALAVDSVSVEIPAPDGGPARIERALFRGNAGFSVPAGGEAVSDPVDCPIRGLSRITVNARIVSCPAAVTSHPGSRTTSWIDSDVPVDHWYFLSGLDVLADSPRGAIAAVGDSITDGRGTTTNHDRRWTDFLSRRLTADPALRGTAVINSGLGGNRLLADGLGPSGLSRIGRDAVGVTGARWLILFEGVNDIGTWDEGVEGPEAFLARLTDGFRQAVRVAEDGGLKAYGGTIAPFSGSQYGSPGKLAMRDAVNRWILESGAFDATIDFAAAVSDPGDPRLLAAAFDSGDHLHLNDDGYKALAEAIDLRLFSLS